MSARRWQREIGDELFEFADNGNVWRVETGTFLGIRFHGETDRQAVRRLRKAWLPITVEGKTYVMADGSKGPYIEIEPEVRPFPASRPRTPALTSWPRQPRFEQPLDRGAYVIAASGYFKPFRVAYFCRDRLRAHLLAGDLLRAGSKSVWVFADGEVSFGKGRYPAELGRWAKAATEVES